MSRGPTDPLAGTPCELAQPWQASHERSPYENLRALRRALDGDPATLEITTTAWRYIPGMGPEATHVVERIHEEFAEEHALARIERWIDARDDLPTIALPDARTRPEDDGNVIPNDVVHATLEYRLGARSPRLCLDHDPDCVVECAGPDGSGYKCPECGQQRRRDDDVLDTLREAWTDDTTSEPTDETRSTDASTHAVAETATDGGVERTTEKTESATTKPTTSDDSTASDEENDDDTQLKLGAFGDNGGGR